MLGDSEPEESEDLSDAPALPDDAADVKEFSETEELSGKPGREDEKEGLPHTVLDADRPDIDLGNMVFDAVNNNAMFFTPEILMEKLVKDYRNAKQLYGDRLIRQLSGYSPDYVEKNLNIPEFKRHLQERIKQNFDDLKDKGVLTKQGAFSDEALEMATISLAVQELDHLTARGLIGRRVHKKRSVSGTREEVKPFSDESYRSLNVQQTVKTALRRGHGRISVDDLRVHEREARGQANIIYALDASGSMKGAKIAQAKRAGVALAYQAIRGGDKVGLVVFGKQVDISLPPGSDFPGMLQRLARLRTGSETDIVAVIEHALDLFPRRSGEETNHLILLTDALPTIGEDPEGEVLAKVAEAKAAGVSISVIGVALDDRGESLARRMTDIGEGRLSLVTELEQMDLLVLEEYDRIRSL